MIVRQASARGLGRAVALNTVAQFGSYVFNTVLATIVAIVVTRHLGRTEYGVMAFVVAYASFFQILTSMGADTVLVRDIARRPGEASNLIGGALSLRVVLSALTMCFAWGIVVLFVEDHRVIRLVMLYSTSFLFSFSALYLIIFNVELRSHVSNLALGAWSIAYSIIRVGLVAADARVEHFLAADVVSWAVCLGVSAWVSRRYSSLRPRFRLDLPLWRRLLAEGWPIAAANWFIALHWRIDQLLLFRWGGAGELGIYAVAVRASEIWGAVANAFIVSIFPLLSRDAVDNQEAIVRTANFGYRCLYTVICPISLALTMYSAAFLGLVFGPAFVEGANALMVLAVAEVFVFSNGLTYNLLFSMNCQREAALVASVSLAINIALNLWLIPANGSMGAAAASLGSYVTVPTLVLLLPRVRWVGAEAFASLGRPVAASGLTAIALWSLSPEFIAGLALITLIYPIALMMVGGLSLSDLKLVAKAWSVK
jgi:O-antigen/teichoic acid export membrane protein